MSDPYEEILEGEAHHRSAPGERPELICGCLHDYVRASVSELDSTQLLPRRSQVKISPSCTLCPDLALIAAATGKLWLAAEIISSEDHRTDTVDKKQIYEELKLPRLWMID